MIFGEVLDGGADNDTLLVLGKVNVAPATTITNIEKIELHKAVEGGESRAIFASDQFNSVDKTDGISRNVLIKGDETANNVLDVRMTSEHFSAKQFRFQNWDAEDHLIVMGSSERNIINGSKKDDFLSGEAGDDVIFGAGGNDVLAGGKESDVLRGGRGMDTFQFHGRYKNVDSHKNKNKSDIIVDFDLGGDDDIIDLSGIDARNGRGANKGDQAFSFIHVDSFSGNKGELRFTQTTDATHVLGDINGNGKVDFRILLDGHFDLTADDFIL